MCIRDAKLDEKIRELDVERVELVKSLQKRMDTLEASFSIVVSIEAQVE